MNKIGREGTIMKKIFALLSALLALAACTKELEAPVVVPEDDQQIVVDITIDRTDVFEDVATRATVKKTWDDGDVVYLFFAGIAAPKHLEAKYNKGTWKASPKNGLSASNLSDASNKKVTAVFLPYANDATVAADNYANFVFNDVTYNGVFYFDISEYTYDGALHSSLNLKALPRSSGGKYVHFNVSGFEEGHTYSLYQDNLNPIIFGEITHTGGITSGNQNGPLAGHIDEERGVLSFSGVLAEEAVGTQIDYQFSIIDETASILYTRDAGNHTISKHTAIGLGDLSDASKWTATEFVYMGINLNGQKICWAKKNLGATTEIGEGSFGNYYNYMKTTGHAASGTYGNYTMDYSCNKENYDADPDGDPAHYELKGLWRLPTKAEFQALIDNNNALPAYFDISTVEARLRLSSRYYDYRDKELNLPVAGYVTNGLYYTDGRGCYWTSTPQENSNDGAYYLLISMAEPSKNLYVSSKYSASFSVRPVFSVSSLNAGVTGNVNKANRTHEYVDMGYGMKWATMNIGANNPEESGDYFAWGETDTKASYSLSTYFDPDSQIYPWQSGPTLGRSLRLKREDDAAHALWGDDWRMPNYEEISMLADKSKFTWTWDNAKKGYKVTSKQTGNSIFLPASGYMSESTIISAGLWGAVWASSSRLDRSVDAQVLYFANMYGRDGLVYSSYRYNGSSIRPIRVNKVNGHEYIDLGNGLGWAVENLGTDDSHPAGRADTFATGDPATAKWGAPWRTPTQAEWQWVFNTNNCYRENTASFENAGWWFINKGSLDGSSQLPDRAILLRKNGNDGGCRYWTSTKNADGKLLYISVTDDYIKYIGGNEAGYQGVLPVFSLSELDK